MFKKEEVDKLAQKVAEAIGEDLLTYTPNQIRAFEPAMGRLLKRHNGQSTAIPHMECIGTKGDDYLVSAKPKDAGVV